MRRITWRKEKRRSSRNKREERKRWSNRDKNDG